MSRQEIQKQKHKTEQSQLLSASVNSSHKKLRLAISHGQLLFCNVLSLIKLWSNEKMICWQFLSLSRNSLGLYCWAVADLLCHLGQVIWTCGASVSPAAKWRQRLPHKGDLALERSLQKQIEGFSWNSPSRRLQNVIFRLHIKDCNEQEVLFLSTRTWARGPGHSL